MEVVVLSLGAYAAVIGATRLLDLRNMAAATLTYYATSFLAGAVLTVLGILILVSSQTRRIVAMSASFAVAVLAVNQVVGVTVQSIICSTPT
ncbi:MAG: hypothetical protein HYX26_07535 [Acidobacteriales bacterium]|nr:hypothetical protein [Terriglobales bacterium]